MHCVAQLVRAPDCDSGGRGFEPHRDAKNETPFCERGFLFSGLYILFESIKTKKNQYDISGKP